MKEKINKIRNTQKGITLVALVITIIVMLLLSVVSINIMQNAGIIEKVKLAKEEHRASTIQEQKELFEKEIEISKYEGNTPKTINDLLNKLEEQKLITEEEKNTIIETGRVTIGSKEIIFDKIILPEGYTRCEYLESTGTQYIDTKMVQTFNAGWELKANIIFSDNTGIIGGFNNNNNSRFGAVMFRWEYKDIMCDILSSVTCGIKEWSNSFSIKNIYSHDKRGTYINNELVYSYETTNANSTGVSTKIFSGFNIFTRNAKGKIYYAKLFDNESNIIWNGIPCLDTNGTPCMYDTVSGQTFYNQGTGEFIAGPIVE